MKYVSLCLSSSYTFLYVYLCKWKVVENSSYVDYTPELGNKTAPSIKRGN